MTYPQTTRSQDSGSRPVLYASLELSSSKWLIGSAPGHGSCRRVEVAARDVGAVFSELDRAKARFGRPADCPVRCCYEAGRDGFWLHRELVARGIENVVIDAGSIEVSRKKRQAKTDRLDVALLLRKLIHYWGGDEKAFRVVEVPTREQEDERRLHRELDRLKRDRTRLRNRIWADLALEGLRPKNLRAVIARPESLCGRDGKPLPRFLQCRVEMAARQLEIVMEQIKKLERDRTRMLREGESEGARKAKRLLLLRSLGPVSSWLLSMEFFGWRRFGNRRQVAACAGLTGSPYASGSTNREQGLSKGGNRRVRTLMIELSWIWLRHQPDSKITRWWKERFAAGGKRMRKVGIAAVARRLLIALWRFVEHGEVPEGAVMKVN